MCNGSLVRRGDNVRDIQHDIQPQSWSVCLYIYCIPCNSGGRKDRKKIFSCVHILPDGHQEETSCSRSQAQTVQLCQQALQVSLQRTRFLFEEVFMLHASSSVELWDMRQVLSQAQSAWVRCWLFAVHLSTTSSKVVKDSETPVFHDTTAWKVHVNGLLCFLIICSVLFVKAFHYTS